MLEKRAAEIFDLEQFARCPGEENCERFASAAGDTPEAKERNACTACELFPTKIKSIADTALDGIVDEVQRLRQEQNAGRNVDVEKLEWLIWEGLVIWRELEAAYQRRHQANINRIAMVVEAILTR